MVTSVNTNTLHAKITLFEHWFYQVAHVRVVSICLILRVRVCYDLPPLHSEALPQPRDRWAGPATLGERLVVQKKSGRALANGIEQEHVLPFNQGAL